MALVNIEQWRAERGFNSPGGPQGFPDSPDSNAPPPPPTSPEFSDHIATLEAEVLRQADLIRALQAALRTYVDREEQARLAGLAAARKPRMARVKRRPRQTKAPIPAPPVAPVP